MISRCKFPLHYKLRITLRIRVGHSPFSFCGGELNIRVSFMLNHKVIELTVHLINNLKRRVIENRRADASRLSGPHLMAPTLSSSYEIVLCCLRVQLRSIWSLGSIRMPPEKWYSLAASATSTCSSYKNSATHSSACRMTSTWSTLEIGLSRSVRDPKVYTISFV